MMSVISELKISALTTIAADQSNAAAIAADRKFSLMQDMTYCIE
jgi:hypothetical protein